MDKEASSCRQLPIQVATVETRCHSNMSGKSSGNDRGGNKICRYDVKEELFLLFFSIVVPFSNKEQGDVSKQEKSCDRVYKGENIV